MNFQCLASPHAKANTTGHIVLRCDARELVVQHVKVRRHNVGDSSSPISRTSQSRIPWSEVRAQRWGEDQLFLDLGAGRTQLNRLCLTRFAAKSTTDTSNSNVQRGLLWGIAAAVLSLGVLVAVQNQTAIRLDSAKLALLVTASAATVFMGRLSMANLWMIRSGTSRQVLQALTAALKERGARFLPADMELSSSNAGPFGARPGSGWAVTAALGVTAIAAWISWIPGRLVTPPQGSALPATATHEQQAQGSLKGTAPPPSNQQQEVTVEHRAVRPGPPVTPAPLLPSKSSPLQMQEGQCSCIRSNSPLWNSPLPRLSTLVVNAKTTERGPSRRTTLELAVVNNGNTELSDLALSVEFPKPSMPGKAQRHSSTLRPLFYAGPLHPGRAVKWSVEGPGEEFRIIPPPLGNLSGDSSHFASVAEFTELTEARTREVRLHAAKMLTYLGAPDARNRVTSLLAEGVASERDFLEQLLKASGPTRACELKNDPATGTVTGCLFNASDKPLTVEELKLSALDADSPNWVPSSAALEFLTPKAHSITAQLPPRSGKPFVLSATKGDAAWLAPVHISGSVETTQPNP